MESQNRNVWIIVGVVAIGLCCCALASAAGVAGWFMTSWGRRVPSPWEWGGQPGAAGERIEQTFEVGEASRLVIDNFAGTVTVRAGERGEVHVVATKRATWTGDMDRIEVDISERNGEVMVRTRKPTSVGNASVDLEVTTPAKTDLDLSTGAGSVEVSGLDGSAKMHTGAGSVTARELSGKVKLDSGAGSVSAYDVGGSLELDTGSGRVLVDGMQGDVDAHTGSGSIDVRGATGQVRVDTGSGSIEYQGTPQDDCRFETGTGSITLRLPSGLDASVELETGSGSVSVGFAVDGQVSRRTVKGFIGQGDGVRIYAHTGTGSIDLIRQ